jgi:hypothetical protein
MTEKKLCFVVSPIGKPDSEVRTHADWVLDGIIRPVMDKFPDFHVKRADNDARPGQIDTHMIDDLLNADLVIADLSLLNPNVFYEIGIRHMAQKPIIHMQLASEDVPFDVSLYRAIKFSREKYSDLQAAKSELEKAVQAVLTAGYQVENPVTRARGRIKLEEHATPDQRVILEELSALKARVNQIDGSSDTGVFKVLIKTSPKDENDVKKRLAIKFRHTYCDINFRSAGVILLTVHSNLPRFQFAKELTDALEGTDVTISHLTGI